MLYRLTFVSFGILLASILFSPSSPAQSYAEIADLKLRVGEQGREIEALNARLADFEADRHVSSNFPAEKASWFDRFKLKGDFRYRFERIERDDHPTTGASRNRDRSRLRARIFIGAEVNDQVDFGMQIASGNDDPVSTNQSFDDDWSTKDVGIDTAYFDYHPFEGDFKLNFVGGKMKVPFAVMSKSKLIWDPDIRPEGLAGNFSAGNNGFSLFGHGGLFYIDERSGSADQRMVGGQLGIMFDFGGEMSVTAGAGYYDYGQVEGEEAFVDEDDGSGNSTITIPDPADGTNTIDVYRDDFNELEFFAEFATELPIFGGTPFSVFGNYVRNMEADDEDTGWLTGFKIGKVKKLGDVDFRYQYKHLDMNAVIGAFTDSDFAGGGTNAEGHEINLGVGLGKSWSLCLSYFVNDISIAGDRRDGAAEEDYERLQVDIKLKF